MTSALQSIGICSFAALLAACGGTSTEQTSAPPLPRLSGKLPTQSDAAVSHPAADYVDVVQRLYIAYFGRPADVQGLDFWTKVYSDRHMPLTVPEIIRAYATDATVKAMVDTMIQSPESRGLYTGNNAAYINAIYLNNFNRNAEAKGRAFWSGFLERGQISRGLVALWILDGAQHEDAVVVAKKVQAATRFTAALPAHGVAAILVYSGESPNEGTRALLGKISATTEMAAFQKDIDDFIESIILIPGPLPTVARYSGFNYLQDMSDGPAYSAHYLIQRPSGVAGPQLPPTGDVVFGVTPQTVSWTRPPQSSVITYAAPITASAGISQYGGVPTISMLCRATADATNPQGKSTDVLVSNSATMLLSASDLSNQRLSVYREDCALSGQGGVTSNVQSFVFDSAGNATVSTAAGTATYSASVVSAILNGQVAIDLSTGKFIALRAYHYFKPDNTDGYAIVSHIGTERSALKGGVLAVWAQE